MQEKAVLKVAIIRPGKKTRELVITKKHLIKGGIVIGGAVIGGVIGAKVASTYMVFHQECVTGFLYL